MRTRGTRIESLDGLDTIGECFFCAEPVMVGAAWHGQGDPLRICTSCARDGALGKLLGDAARDCHDLDLILDATAREAWRALALAQERNG